ncbi:MAG: LysM peptidoglycan-binding domain-containing protein [Bdellovibrionales bacterium]|nr:LysM peptidoglycan-binding domain-containing protein [Bdellovibrionales bacterium]MBT3527171.1 LysM peptidoglycan-binding domain-containing protein [Bdellovibrionales bacterium]MBT7668149.1 LysM peptidoglycan-binding domain-containing protein [Bdellovibrionales bacterium]MBT7766858.1 LysM peptidoglycan-binding domain-containing protein [Bdellovibrionales bacterium]
MLSKYVLLSITIIMLVGIAAPVSDSRASSDSFTTYTIRRGDDLMAISMKFYGTHLKWREISKANPNLDVQMLITGTEIYIPLKSGSKIKKRKIRIAQVEDNGHILKPAPVEALKPQKITAPIVAVDKPALSPVAILDKPLLQEDIIRQQKEVLPEVKSQNKVVVAPFDDPGAYDNFAEKQSELRNQAMDFTTKRSPASSNDELSRSKTASGINSEQDFNFYLKTRQLTKELKLEKIARKADSARLEQQQQQIAKLNGMLDAAQKLATQTKVENKTLTDRIVKLEMLTDDRQRLQGQLKTVSSRLGNVNQENRRLSRTHHLFDPMALAYSQDQVLREKNRLLSQRFWLEKNKELNKCSINIAGNPKSDRKLFSQMVLLLTEQFGSNAVNIDPGLNELTLQLPGEVVYGVDTPQMRRKYLPTLAKINYYLKQLSISHFHITGHSMTKAVRDRMGKIISAEHFMLKQAMTLQNYIINELSWSSDLVTAGSVSFVPDKLKYSIKRFSLRIKFKSPVMPKNSGRAVASILAKDSVLKNMRNDIFVKLNKPTESRIDINHGGVDIHMAQKYFYRKNQPELTSYGEGYLNSIMDMFSLVSDAKFEVVWAPGVLDRDEDYNRGRALQNLEEIKQHIHNNYQWAKGRVEFIYSNRQAKLFEAFSSKGDQINRRLTFRMKPMSITVRPIGEIEDN